MQVGRGGWRKLAILWAGGVLDRVALFARPCAPAPDGTDRAGYIADDGCAGRSCVQEMLSRNPDAFNSDLDVQCLMQHYRDGF